MESPGQKRLDFHSDNIGVSLNLDYRDVETSL